VMGKLMTAGQDVTVSHGVGLLAGTALAALFWRWRARRMAAFGATVALAYFAVKTIRLLELQLGHGLHEWLPPILRGSAGSDALAWAWVAYWLLAALILIAAAWRSADPAPVGRPVQPWAT